MNFLLAFLLIGLGSRFQIVAIFTGMLWMEILNELKFENYWNSN